MTAKWFQSSFELTGYITREFDDYLTDVQKGFQSSFELTGYITVSCTDHVSYVKVFQSSFELTGYITKNINCNNILVYVSKLFRAYGLYN